MYCQFWALAHIFSLLTDHFQVAKNDQAYHQNFLVKFEYKKSFCEEITFHECLWFELFVILLDNVLEEVQLIFDILIKNAVLK